MTLWQAVPIGFSDNSVLAIGGVSQAGQEPSVEVLGVNLVSWKSGPSLPHGISGAAVVMGPNGEAILIGGLYLVCWNLGLILQKLFYNFNQPIDKSMLLLSYKTYRYAVK